jgi:hypothetical protein
MATCDTTSAGDVTSAAKWDALPGAGDKETGRTRRAAVGVADGQAENLRRSRNEQQVEGVTVSIATHTVCLCCIILALIVAWDGYCAWCNKIDGDTISEILRGWNRSSYGAVCLAWAALGWHLFVSQNAWR